MPDGFGDENPPWGGAIVRGRQWLVGYSEQLAVACSSLTDLATAKVQRRSKPAKFQTESKIETSQPRLSLALVFCLEVGNLHGNDGFDRASCCG